MPINASMDLTHQSNISFLEHDLLDELGKRLKEITNNVSELIFKEEDYQFVRSLRDSHYTRFPTGIAELQWHPVFPRVWHVAGLENNVRLYNYKRLKDVTGLIKATHLGPQKKASFNFDLLYGYMNVQRQANVKSMIMGLNFVFECIKGNLKFHRSICVARYILLRCEENGAKQRREIKIRSTMKHEHDDKRSRLYYIPTGVIKHIESYLVGSHKKHIESLKFK